MFGFFQKRKKPNLTTLSYDFEQSMSTKLSRRYLRVFFSHRWQEDGYLHKLLAAEFENFQIEDMSLSEERRMLGARGGMVDEVKIKREIAARIYASDILIAPSTKAAIKSRRIKADKEYVEIETDWISWEIQIAAICFNIPVLFVDERVGLRRRNPFYNKLKAEGAKVGVSLAATDHIMFAIDEMFDSKVLDYKDSESEIQELHTMRVPADFERILNLHPYRKERGELLPAE